MLINRRQFMQAVGLGAVCAMVGPGAEEKPKRPNIILCMADDQGWGDVAYNGHPRLKTPHLDDMAKSGLRFDQFYAAAPVCSPTRASVMTGRHPNRMGCFRWGYTLRPQEVTVAEALKSVGYSTAHFGKWHLGPVLRGAPTNPGASGFDAWLSAPNFYDNDPILSDNGIARSVPGESSMVAAEAALEFMGEHLAGDSPFLAVVWFGSPHRPHRAAEEDRAHYADLEEKQQHLLGEITGLDRAVGRLRAGLQEMGIAEDTLFWYCSDNGGLPESGATGGRSYKGSVYEGGLRVPAIIEWPGTVDARVCNFPCVTSDIYPTLLELTGTKVAHQPTLDGKSLLPVIQSTSARREGSIGFWDYPAKGFSVAAKPMMEALLAAQKEGQIAGDPAELRLDVAQIPESFPTPGYRGHAAWLSWPWKLHRIEEESGAVTLELYNLESDPREAQNRVEAEPDRVASMRSELEEWQASLVASYLGGDY